MKKVQVSFNYKGQNIYVLANYYKGYPATLEEPGALPSYEIIELYIGKTEFDSVEDLAEYLNCDLDKLEDIILENLENNLDYGKHF